MRSRNLNQVLCFVRTKHGASRLARQLEKDGLITSAIHGDKDQKARLEALEAFKEGKLQVLVATDVAARGLDIDDLPLVRQLRAAATSPRTTSTASAAPGAPGPSGEAISFVAPDEERYLSEIERLLKKTVPIDGRRGLRSGGRQPARARRARARIAARGTPGRRTSRGRRAGGAAPARRRAARTPAARAKRRAERPPREDPRIERERAYALNPDQPLPSRRADDAACRAAPARARVPASATAGRCPRC